MFTLFAFLFAICSAEKNVIQSQEQSGGCSICQLVVSYVESYMKQNATEQEIMKELDGLCSNIPVLGQECTSLVNSELPNIIAWIENKEDPQAFCASIGICSKISQIKVGGPIPCSICQVAVTYVEKWVAENATEVVIIERLDVLCSALGPLGPECDSFNAIYVPKLIEYLIAKEDPQVFCAQIGICQSRRAHQIRKISAKTQHRLQSVAKRNEAELQQTGKCQICQVVVTYVEQLVAQNQTVAEIIVKVDELCSFTPPPLQQVCDTIAAKYIPSLVAWILKKENPQAFCAQVGLCT